MPDFSTAPTGQGTDFELIPDGVLAKGWLLAEPFNAEQGHILTPPKAPATNSYLKCRIVITEGDYERRLVFHNIMRGPGEKALNMGNAQLRAILEYGNGWPQNPKWAYIDDDFGPLWRGDSAGLPVAIKIGIEKGKDGYKDKNVVRLFLSPNPESDGHKDFLRLQKGDTGPAKTAGATTPAWSKPAAPAAPAAGAPAATGGWGSGQQPSAPAVAAIAAPARPTWMNTKG